MEYNDDNDCDNNTRYKLTDCKTQREHSCITEINTTTNNNANGCSTCGWGSTLVRELEMIAMAHEIWNKRLARLTSNNREIKLQPKAYDVSLMPQRISESNSWRSEAITVQQFTSTIRGHREIAIDDLNQFRRKSEKNRSKQ
ncbi:MAG: hypothetical protein EZS28_030450 [Streblomastix strix]|uniref:Uncharacterized protein n=1 Tax=Streblomastix strix TaxID=222440 RepID=A0A5J4UUS0_9EUKA|nr:MAG: hypothetical protein EZS28_030450 [Streblomastix strix]